MLLITKPVISPLEIESGSLVTISFTVSGQSVERFFTVRYRSNSVLFDSRAEQVRTHVLSLSDTAIEDTFLVTGNAGRCAIEILAVASGDEQRTEVALTILETAASFDFQDLDFIAREEAPMAAEEAFGLPGENDGDLDLTGDNTGDLDVEK